MFSAQDQPNKEAKTGVNVGEIVPPRLPPVFIIPETTPVFSREMSITVVTLPPKTRPS